MMKKLLNRLLLVSGGILVLSVSAFFFTLQWIDKQEIPAASDARHTLQFIAIVYPSIPGECSENCVVRTIKIANLVALTEYGKKSPVELSKDLGIGFSLLNRVFNKGDLPNKTAEFEVALERLLFFNRMNALSINWGRHLEDPGLLEEAISLQDYAYDEETKAVLSREFFIFRTLQNANKSGSLDNSLKALPEQFSFADAYQLMTSGMALCAIKNDSGAGNIKQALLFFQDKRINLIRSVGRNLDAPLIAAANENPACQGSIHQLETLLQGD